MSRYANIRKTLAGYQVVLHCHHREPFFPRLGPALECRNRLYLHYWTGPRGAMLARILGPGEGDAAISNTGYRGLTWTYTFAGHARNGERIDVLSLRLRNLVTGRPANRRLRLDEYPSTRAALREGRDIVARNINAYNQIVARYNAIRQARIQTLAGRELQQRRPYLQQLYRFDARTWGLARDYVFPSIADPVSAP